MRILATIDAGDYQDTTEVFEKYSVRGIVMRDGCLAMQRSSEGEYKLPGGGPEDGEDFIQTLVREIHEETGLRVIPSSAAELGEITEKRRDLFVNHKKYICHSLFYFCRVEDGQDALTLTESEKQRGYHLEWARPEEIVQVNQNFFHMPWIKRDTIFIQMIADHKVVLPSEETGRARQTDKTDQEENSDV